MAEVFAHQERGKSLFKEVFMNKNDADFSPLHPEDIMGNDWDNWFEEENVSPDFMPEREQPESRIRNAKVHRR